MMNEMYFVYSDLESSQRMDHDHQTRQQGIVASHRNQSVEQKSMRALFIVLAWVVLMLGLLQPGIANAQRYQAPAINSEADRFNQRATQRVINVDFIVAHTVNSAFHAVREGRDFGDNAIINGRRSGAAAAGSVVIQPGTDVNDLVIINQSEGDNIVIGGG